MNRFGVFLVALALVSAPSVAAGADSGSMDQSARPEGWTAAPLTKVEELPDGGKLNHYEVDGDTVVPVPPADFSPLTASDADLTTYGLPPGPAADADDFPAWSLDMAAWKPGPDLGLCITDLHFGSSFVRTSASTAFVPIGQDEPWSGYVADETSNTYIAVQGDYVQKAKGATSCSPATMGSWVGIGGYSTESLIQTGTAFTSTPTYYAWYEYIDPTHGNPAVMMPNVDVDPGEGIHVYTVHQRSTGQTTFYVYDTTDGTHQSVVKTIASSYYDGKSGEHIAEAAGGTYLGNFGNLNWTNTKVQLLSGTWVSLGSRSPTELKSKYYYTDFNYHITADPDPMSSTTTFTDRWLRCD